MHKKPITLLVELKAKKGMGEKLRQEAIKLIPLTHAETGCVEYNFHVSANDPDTFLFYENWHDKESLDKHLEMPYLVQFKSLLDEILSEPASFTFWDRHHK